jgi:hypothetical protein
MDTPDLDRLTILERAQLLHDATLRRHGDMLDRHAEAMVELRSIQERQERLMETLAGRLSCKFDFQVPWCPAGHESSVANLPF